MKALLVTAALAFIKGVHASLRRMQPTGSLASFVQDGLTPPKQKRVIQPFQYDQRLLVCNAFHSELETPISLTKNGDIIFIEGEALEYRNCRYAKVPVKKGDKLDFFTTDNIAGGTFEVAELPHEDAVLLLVLENSKNESYPMLAQSYSFPLRAQGKAQIAVVDTTLKGDKAKLHISKLRAIQPVQPVVDSLEPVEQHVPVEGSVDLAFDEVYELERGNFTMEVKDLSHKEMKNPPKAMELKGDTDYVLLRIASAKGSDMLVAFPPAEQSGAMSASFCSIMLTSAFLMVYMW